MKQILAILPLLLFTLNTYGTDQETDLLIVGKDTVYLKSFPLDSLKLNERPFGLTWETAPSTACWRGYRAFWRIVDNRLFLERITRCSSDYKEGDENLTELFQRNQIGYQEKDGKILASWVTMDLYRMDFTIAKHYPNRLYLYDGGYDKMKEKNLRLKIINGMVEVNNLKK